MVWIRFRIFRAPKTNQGHPKNGHVPNKRRRKHINEGPYTKVSATLGASCRLLVFSKVFAIFFDVAESFKFSAHHLGLRRDSTEALAQEQDGIVENSFLTTVGVPSFGGKGPP